MQGEIRVTVIATGFDRAVQASAPNVIQQVAAPSTMVLPQKGSPVIPFPNRPARVAGNSTAARPDIPRAPRPATEKPSQDLSDMEIPTFIRRQMD